MDPIDTVTMFTSEISVVEINTLRDDLTLVIPQDFTVTLLNLNEQGTFVRLNRNQPQGENT